jgi:hypothetical protein
VADKGGILGHKLDYLEGILGLLLGGLGLIDKREIMLVDWRSA